MRIQRICLGEVAGLNCDAAGDDGGGAAVWHRETGNRDKHFNTEVTVVTEAITVSPASQ